MKAVAYKRFGPPEVLKVVDIPEPNPGLGEVKLRVHATSVNAMDVLFRSGQLKVLACLRDETIDPRLRHGRLFFGLQEGRRRRSTTLPRSREVRRGWGAGGVARSDQTGGATS